jgi:hypothetical protein
MEAHIAALLPTQNKVVAADSNTTFLAHYDLNEHDVLKGVNAIGNIYALSFDGSANYVRVVNNLGSTSTFTISFWIKDNGPASWSDVLTIDNGDSTNAPRIERTNVVGEYRWYGTGGITSGDILFTHDGTKWENVTIVSDGTNVFCYKNGVQTYTAAKYATPIPATSYINIGKRVTSGPWKGSLMNVAFYNRALTLDEIKSVMYNSVVEKGLVGFYKLNEGQGSVVADSSPFHNDSVIAGTPTWVSGNSVFTLRPKEGYFGGSAMAIEESTINYSNQTVASWNSTVVGTDASTYKGYPVYYADGKSGGSGFLHSASSTVELAVGAKAVYSMWMNRGTANLFPAFYPQGQTFDGTTWTSRDPIGTNYVSRTFAYYNENGDSLGSSIDLANFTGWVKIVITFTNIHTDKIRLTNMFFLDYGYTSGRCYHSQPQMEIKAFPTSFAVGSRPSLSLSYPSANVLNPQAGTISMWVNIKNIPVSSTGWRMLFVVKDGGWITGTETNQISFRSYNSWDNVRLTVGGPTGTSTINSSVPTEGWHMLTATWDTAAQLIKFYVDGAVAGSLTGTTYIPTQFNDYFWLGKWTVDGGDSYSCNSLFDELRIDNIARTDAEIAAWYYSASPFWPRGTYRKPY